VEPELDEEQELFRATTHRFLESCWPLPEVRALQTSPLGYEASTWQRGAELGWTSLLVPEDLGGGSLSGHGLLDLVIVAEEMGRLVSPGPLVPVNVVAAALATWGESHHHDAVLPGLLDGTSVAAWAHAERGLPWGFGAKALRTELRHRGDALVLSGTKSPVEAAVGATWLLASARSGDELVQVLVPADAPGVTITPLEGLDLVRRFGEVRFDSVELPRNALLAVGGDAEAALERQLQLAVVVQCAESCGAIDRVLRFTLDYVADRYSFGRPLASYQALKHRFADMKMWLEASHGITAAAAGAVQRADDAAAELVSAAKSYVGAVGTRLIQECVQMHGGIGVTWEHDLHLYLRRMTVNRAMYGTPEEHRERIARILGMGATT
jgi:alkylation response protein AidB-like acyl-CoA dehydrogenase